MSIKTATPRMRVPNGRPAVVAIITTVSMSMLHCELIWMDVQLYPLRKKDITAPMVLARFGLN